MMFGYQSDVLIIKAFSRNVEKIFPVFSIDDDRAEVEIKTHDPLHNTLLITYMVTDEDKNTEHFPTIVRPRNKNKFGETPIFFERVADKLRLYTDKRTDRYVEKVM